MARSKTYDQSDAMDEKSMDLSIIHLYTVQQIETYGK
jgi:hypothetical protein